MADDAQKPPPSLKADLGLVLVTAVWGSTFLFVKDAIQDADPMTFLVLRFGVAGLASALIAGRTLFDARLWKIGAVMGLAMFASYASQTYGLVYTTPARSAFVTGLSVVLVPIVAMAVLKKRPGVGALVGIALATLGLAWLTGIGSGTFTEHGYWKGDLITLVCATAYSFHILLTDHWASRVPTRPLVATQLLSTAFLALVAWPFVPHHFVATPRLAFAVVFCGVVATSLLLMLQTWAQARTTAVRTALIYALEPVFAASYSLTLGRERLSVTQLLGGLLIVAGVLSSTRYSVGD